MTNLLFHRVKEFLKILHNFILNLFVRRSHTHTPICSRSMLFCSICLWFHFEFLPASIYAIGLAHSRKAAAIFLCLKQNRKSWHLRANGRNNKHTFSIEIFIPKLKMTWLCKDYICIKYRIALRKWRKGKNHGPPYDMQTRLKFLKGFSHSPSITTYPISMRSPSIHRRKKNRTALIFADISSLVFVVRHLVNLNRSYKFFTKNTSRS